MTIKGEKRKGAPKKKLAMLIAVSVTMAIALGAVALVLRFRQTKEEEQEQYKMELQQALQKAKELVSYIKSILTSNAPTTWIYDSEDNLLMTIKLSSAVQSVASLPDEVSSEILRRCNGDPYTLVRDEYLASKGVARTDAVLEGYLQKLTSTFKTADLVRYLAVSSTFSNEFVGIVDASYNYFGVNIGSLNAAQLEFILYCYRNSEVDIDTYLSSRSLTKERLGFLDSQFNYSVIREMVLDELNRIPNLDLTGNSYMVKLTLSSQQQSMYQSVIDNNMRQLITLNPDKSYATDFSMALVEKTTGFVRTYVPCRTSAGSTSRVFHLNSLTFVSNFQALLQELSASNTYNFSLKEVIKSNGDTELKSLKTLFESLELSSDSSVSTLTPLELVDIMYSGNEKYRGTSIIYQIKQAGVKENVYWTDTYSKLVYDNPAVPEYFTDDKETRTTYSMLFDTSTGVIGFQSTPSYDLVYVAGSSALGGATTTTDKNIIKTTITELQSSVSTQYPAPVGMLWDASELVRNEHIAYATNYSMIEVELQDRLTDLLNIEVNSSDSRKEFEQLYESISQFLTDYTPYIGQDYADLLRGRLVSVRLERSEALLKYSV